MSLVWHYIEAGLVVLDGESRVPRAAGIQVSDKMMCYIQYFASQR